MRAWKASLLVLMGSVLVVTGFHQFLVQPIANKTANIIWFGLAATPLLLLIPGVIKFQRTALVVLALVSMFYFIHGVLIATGSGIKTIGYVDIALSLTLMIVAAYAARRSNT